MVRKFLFLIVAVCACMLYGCASSTTCNVDDPNSKWHRGDGEFTFTDYAPLADKPITVYYYIPTQGDVTKMGILFSMHGAQRTSAPGLENWKPFAEKEGFIIIAPEYRKPEYQENDYQFGGIMTERLGTELAEKEKWTYNSIEIIFDLLKKETGNKSETYNMFGHSAGGQFTHRFLLSTPNARVDKAVAANPGSWTFLYEEGLIAESGTVYGWPYSVKNTPMVDEAHLKPFLARNLTVHLGTEDTAVSGKHVPTDEAALAQGKYRYDRGLNFYEHARALAHEKGWEFNWKIVEVKGAGHSGKEMVYGAWETDAEGNKVFNAENYSDNGAYALMYK